MTPYANHSRKSPITAYEIADDSIKVQYRPDWIYLYTYRTAGRTAIEEMKELARAGEGLSTYISRNGPPYESKTPMHEGT